MYDETKNQRDILITQNDEPMVISVDCCIADLIVKLNSKCFYTEYCCSGHEEDAFLSMYIKFYPMDSLYESIIRAFVTNYIDELYVEDNYEIGTTSAEISSNYVQLTDPTPQEIIMAKQIVFRDRINDEELVKQDTSHNITIRAQCAKDYIESLYQFNDWDEFVITNKAKVMRGIKKLEFFMDNFEILGCNPF